MQAEQQQRQEWPTVLAEQVLVRLSQAIEREPEDHTRAGSTVAQPERQQSARSHVHRSGEVGFSVSLLRAVDHAAESPRAEGHGRGGGNGFHGRQQRKRHLQCRRLAY